MPEVCPKGRKAPPVFQMVHTQPCANYKTSHKIHTTILQNHQILKLHYTLPNKNTEQTLQNKYIRHTKYTYTLYVMLKCKWWMISVVTPAL